MNQTSEKEFVLNRFEQIAPKINIDDLDLATIEHHVKIGLEIIGYHPRDFGNSFNKALEKMDGKGELYRICYNTWRIDMYG